MGDRANVYIHGVYLYTHWGGTNLPFKVQTALAKGQRWDDPAYLTRIIFDAMTEDCHGEETGFGISTDPPDNEHLYIVIDCETKQISFRHDSPTGGIEVFWTFQQYVDAEEAEILKHYEA